MTVSIANREIIDGIEVVVQEPNYEKEEFAYLEVTRQKSYDQMEQIKERLLELLFYQKNRLAYRKRTEIAVEIVKQIEAEGQFPEANYAFESIGLRPEQMIVLHFEPTSPDFKPKIVTEQLTRLK